MRTAGVILDIYDDPQGLVLREKLSREGTRLPEKLAAARLLDSEDLEALPDRLFALVATNGDHVLRKYAMHDAAHLSTSIIYFLERGDVLPDEAQKVAAKNLVNACAWYDMEPPTPLVKVALLGTAMKGLGAALGVTDLASRATNAAARHRATMDSFRLAQTAGAKVAARKVADLTGTEMMPVGAAQTPVRTQPHRRGLPLKVAERLDPRWQDAGDLSRAEPPVVEKTATYEHFALPHAKRYPIDTVDQVKQACAYFDEYYHELGLLDRRIYARSVEDRAEELGTKLSGAAMEYAGNTYGSYIESELVARAHSFEGTDHDAAYETLRERIDEVPPFVMAELLFEADKLSGAWQSYGRPATGFRDPYASVYAKVAEEASEYTWTSGTDHASESSLRKLARAPAALKNAFGEDFGRSFAKDPVGIFKSLPDPEKTVISRLAAQAH